MKALFPDEGGSPVLYSKGCPSASCRAYWRWIKVSSRGTARFPPLPHSLKKNIKLLTTTVANPSQSISYRCESKRIPIPPPITEFHIPGSKFHATGRWLLAAGCWLLAVSYG